MVKAVFFDVDGTLVSHRYKRVPESTIESLAKLRENGIKIFLSTGRHLQELDKLPLQNLSFDGYVTLNGQLCADQDKKILYSVPLAREETDTLVSIFEKKEFPLILVEEKGLYINFINDVVRKTQEAISTPLPDIAKYEGAPVYMAIGYFTPEEEYVLKELLPDSCKMTRWGNGGVDVIPRYSGKVMGIQKILEHYHLKQEEIMAFGDGENDRDMLAYAGIGVAMGNAEDDVKSKADYITDDIDKDGIEKALKHFQLII